MTIGVVLFVLLAALLHASWNALLRAGADRLWSMTMMSAAVALVCGGLTFVVQVPARASWGCVVLSALLHVGYNLFLVRTYRSGDLGQTYPIARGSAPPLVAFLDRTDKLVPLGQEGALADFDTHLDEALDRILAEEQSAG